MPTRTAPRLELVQGGTPLGRDKIRYFLYLNGRWRWRPTKAMRAQGFGRHSFLCGQSGSGKTYALGVILEQVLLGTGLRMVVLDPNADFVGLSDVRADAADEARARLSGLDVRVLGAIGVIEVDRPVDLGRATPVAIDHGVWLRPFRNLIYVMPPYICTPAEIATITSAMTEVARALT